MAHLGCVLIGCVLAMESVSPEHRRIPSIMIGIGLGVGGVRRFQFQIRTNRNRLEKFLKRPEFIIVDKSIYQSMEL